MSTTTTPVTTTAPLNLRRELVDGRAGTIAATATLTIASSAATLALPLIVAALIDAVQQGAPLSGVATLLVVVGLGAAVTGAGAAHLVARLGERLVSRLRTRVIGHALHMRPGDIAAHGSGDIASRLTADTLMIKAAVDIVPVQLPSAAITLVGTLIIMGVLDWVLLLVTLGGFTVAAVLVVLVMRGLRSRYRCLQDALGALNHRFICALEALTVIKSTRSESRITADLAADVNGLRRTGVSAAKLESMVVPAVNLGQQIALLTVLIGGGARLVNGSLTLAEFIGFLLYLLQLTAPLILAASALNTVQAGMLARDRFNSVLGAPTEADDTVSTPAPSTAPAGAEWMESDGPAVRLQAVTAGYGDRPALDGVSLSVPSVGLTSLVGPSGSGKTTVLRLVERLLCADSGTVEVFGRSVCEQDLGDLRRQIAYVDQDYTLLEDTVRANLCLGWPEYPTDPDVEVDDDTLYSALERVGMAEDIRQMPAGLDTRLAAGRGLSGGQCQRLALARALLSDAPLILLDEPTSALDATNEDRLRTAILEIARDRAVLVVAHRLSTVRDARHVVVLDGGRVHGQGQHSELLEQDGLYRELVNLQLLPGDGAAAALIGSSR